MVVFVQSHSGGTYMDKFDQISGFSGKKRHETDT